MSANDVSPLCSACHHDAHDPGSCPECPRCELHTDEAIEFVRRHEPGLLGKTDMYREMYKAVAEKWGALLERFGLDPDSSPDDVIEAARR